MRYMLLPEPSPDTEGTLLFRTRPIAGESLPGYLVRVTALNHLPRVGTILGDAGINWTSPDLSRLVDGHVAQLATAIGVEPGDLDPLLVQAKAQHVDIFGVRLTRRRVVHGARRVSPRALRASLHHRAAWMIRPLSYCAEAWDQLIDRCPDGNCNAPLTWNCRFGLESCSRCGLDLRAAASIDVPQEDRPALAILAGLVGPDEQQRASAVQQLPKTLQRLPPGTLFEIALCCARADIADAAEARRVAVGKVMEPSQLAAGIRYLTGHPRSFEAKAQNAGPNTGLPRFFSRLTRASHEATDTAVAEFLDEVVRAAEPIRHGPSRLRATREASEHLTLRQAAEGLKISRSAAKELVTDGHLAGSQPRGECRIHRWFEPTAVERVAARLRRQVSPAAFCRAWGLPMAGLEQVLALELLKLSADRTVRAIYSAPRLDRPSADKFVAAVRTRITALGEVRYVLLADIFKGIGAREKPWGSFLRACLADQLPCTLGALRSDRFRFDELMVPEDCALDVIVGRYPKLVQPILETNHLQRPAGMTRQEVQCYLNCYPRDVSWLLEQQHLSGGARPRDTIPRWEVRSLGRELISSLEISRRWRISSEMREAFPKRGIVRALGPFWPRKAVTDYLSFIFPTGRPVQEDPRW